MMFRQPTLHIFQGSCARVAARSRGAVGARGVAGNSVALKAEGAGNAGCPLHPQPRARLVVEVCARVFTAEAPGSSGIPHAMVLRLIRDLPGDRAFLPPSFAGLFRALANLIPASGNQDHTISPSASGAFVLAPSASTAACPNVSDDGQRPSSGTGCADDADDLPDEQNGIFFREGLDSNFAAAPVGQISLIGLAKIGFHVRITFFASRQLDAGKPSDAAPAAVARHCRDSRPQAFAVSP